MRLPLFLVLAFATLGCFGGCSGTVTSPANCPVTTVTIDAGIDGLPDVGEYITGQLCESLWGAVPFGDSLTAN
jgi:hypothetical protein